MAKFSKTDSKGYTHALEVTEVSYDVEKNTSVVSYKYTLTSGSNNGFAGYGIEWGIWINGVRVMYHAWKSAEYTCYKGGNVINFGSGTVTIEHENDGSKSIECYAQILRLDGANYCPVEGTKPSGTLKLTDIPRGFVYIDNGETVEAYQCFIDDGAAFNHHMPYADNGAAFDMIT